MSSAGTLPSDVPMHRLPFLRSLLPLTGPLPQFDTSDGHEQRAAGIRRRQGDHIAECSQGLGDPIKCGARTL